ncbi:hypothetical protein JOC75_002844 [Metabacillus crassostreae]|uniref:LXG domain-containing protein n=1 Tax=Metabacillus crassostreae TaxID=929098 RepID=UPI00195BD2FB|nr:LXG domain-containing protein [Metabacillus crassostreae]MBM7604840.1 hypothetical protein [Metabacillus crassostreae]
MKILKVSEVVDEIDQIIQKKEKEKEQILSIRNTMNQIIELDEALKGKTGEAIREHFTVLHIPVILLLNQFLDQYIIRLNETRKKINEYESDNGLISEEFIEVAVQKGLTKIERLTHDTVSQINQYYAEVSHLVYEPSVTTGTFDFKMIDTKEHLKETIEKLNTLDERCSSDLQSSAEDLKQLSQFIAKIKGWTNEGISLSQETVRDIEEYFLSTNTIQKMIDDAIDLSVKQGDSTFMGDIASWLDLLGKGNGALDVAKGALAVSILSTKLLALNGDGKGNFKVIANPNWTMGSNKKYESKLASTIYNIMKKGDKNSNNIIKQYLSKYNNTPSGLLRSLIGLNSNTTRISFGKIIEEQNTLLRFSQAELKSYRMKFDIKATVDQFTDAKKFATLGRRVPYVGIVFSITTNSGEFFSDKNQYKSDGEKIGRFAGGIGLDIGIAGLTTGGAAIGTLICPGIGTVIGGAVGAGIGIVGSWAIEDKVKDFGESVGHWIENDVADYVKDSKENVTEIFSDATNFVTGFFK